MQATNLNHLAIQDDGYGETSLEDHSLETAGVSAYFRDLERHLIGHIEKADYVFGCVAWLTHPNILRALAKKKGVSIVVQKEDFLRPDMGVRKGWAKGLRRLYDAIPNKIDRFWMPGLVKSLSSCADPTLQPIRCVGNHNKDRDSAFPRAHHKFAVFAKSNPVHLSREHTCSSPASSFEEWPDRSMEAMPCEGCASADEGMVFQGVWTGSFNFTKNATASFENAVVIRDPNVCKAFYSEYAQIVALSEPLDWTSDWCAPEWRIGT